MARTSGIAYWVDEAWRRAARARLKELGWKQVDLAREARVKPNTITTLLEGGEGGTSTHVHLPRIHAALGWPKPNPPLHPERVRRRRRGVADVHGPVDTDERRSRRARAAEFVTLALELERLSPAGFDKAIREIRRLLKIR